MRLEPCCKRVHRLGPRLRRHQLHPRHGDLRREAAPAAGHLEAGFARSTEGCPRSTTGSLTDHCADLCLAPTRTAVDRLATEGSAPYGSCRRRHDRRSPAGLPASNVAHRPPVRHELPFALVTLHRAENTDDPLRLRAIIGRSDAPLRVVLAAHPRLLKRCSEFGIDLTGESLEVIAPLSYPQLVAALGHATGVITDSGGLQKEAHFLGVPTTTLRPETEWVNARGRVERPGAGTQLHRRCRHTSEAASSPRLAVRQRGGRQSRHRCTLRKQETTHVDISPSRQRVVHLSTVHRASDPRIFEKECRTLADGGYEVVLIATGSPEPSSFTVTALPRSPRRLIRMTWGCARAVAKALSLRPALVHLHDLEPIPWIPILKSRGALVVFDAHEDIPGVDDVQALPAGRTQGRVDPGAVAGPASRTARPTRSS